MSPFVRFLRRRLERRGPYGLAFTLAFAAVAAALAGFVQVLDAVSDEEGLVHLDALAHSVLYDAFGRRTGLGLAVTWFGNNATLIVLILVAILGLVLGRRYWTAFRVAFASGAGGLVITGLKLIFARARPLEPIVPAEGYSFPSGHAFASTVFYGMMIYVVWSLTENRVARAAATIVGLFMVTAVGLSRVYLNVHFLTDVLAGWLAGGAWLVASLILVHVVETRTEAPKSGGQHPGLEAPPPSEAT